MSYAQRNEEREMDGLEIERAAKIKAMKDAARCFARKCSNGLLFRRLYYWQSKGDTQEAAIERVALKREMRARGLDPAGPMEV